MKLGLILVAIISIAALVGTIAAAGKVEKDYGKSTKQNTMRLSAIYIILFIFSIVGVAWYIVSL
jgi:cytochrome c biogenesis protein ResB